MNNFFAYWVDLVAMLLSLILALVFTLRYKKQAGQALRAVPLFFLLFGPLVIIVHMGFHNFEIAYRAVVNALAGAFTYNFHFYSLMLMGILITWLSVTFLKQSVRIFVTGINAKSGLLQTAGIIALITLPTIPFTPIGTLPLMACIITIVASRFVRKKVVLLAKSHKSAPERVIMAPISTGA